MATRTGAVEANPVWWARNERSRESANCCSRLLTDARQFGYHPYKPRREIVMKAWSKLIVVAIAASLSAFAAGTAAQAAEITVVAGGGPLPDVLGTLMPMFEKATGNTVKISFKGEPAATADLKSGAADLVIINTEIVDAYAKDGTVAAGGNTLLMISKVAVGVKAGAPKPDVSTPDKLKAALLAAKTVGYSQGSSGQHFQTVIQKLGIADA